MEFLKKTAQHLLKYDTEKLINSCVVLPNRRAAVFLKKYISSDIEKAIFLPRITSIQDFVIELSGKSILDEYSALVALYKSYTTVKTNDTESFDDFLKWGTKLLHDFDEIDQQLADAHFIFTYLKEDKNLVLWSLDKKPLSEFQQNYLNFYEILYDIYANFTQRIAEKGFANYGMACRIAVERLQKKGYANKYQKVIFAGLNALGTAEKTIIEYYLHNETAEILWDADAYYIDNPKQEAGNFIRSYLSQWHLKETNWIDTNLASDEKEIHIVGIAGNIGQAKYTAGEIAHLLSNDSKSENISIILNEESLLIPMLNSIPDGIDRFNITMGFPMKLSPVFTLFEIIFTLHENSERFRDSKKAAEPLFYFQDLQKLFGHSFFTTLLNSETKNKLVAQLIGQGKIFYTRGEVLYLLSNHTEKVPESVRNIFASWYYQSKNAIVSLISLIHDIKNIMPIKQSIEQEFLYEAHKVLNQIKQSEEESGIMMTPRTLHQIFKQAISQSTIPFVGEPLNGLQIMGMLETRALDFETVFMLSVNEGVLPKGKSNASFIPHGIRQDAGMTTYVHNEHIFAYHFYHVLQRSKKIYLLYNTQADDFGGGEKSRFINQLIYELPKYNPKIKIIEEFVALLPLKDTRKMFVIKKDDAIMEKLDRIGAKGVSPSALNIYRKCKLQYYFGYIAGIREADELTEILDNREFGNQIHDVLQHLYESIIGQELMPEILDNFIKIYEDVLMKNFLQNKNDIDRLSGKNLLIYNVIKDYVRDFLEREKETVKEECAAHISHRVMMIEEKLDADFTIPIGGKPKTIHLTGKLDRVDKIGDRINIIDYKTGNVSNKDFNFHNLFLDDQNSKFDYAFQLMCYAYLFTKTRNIAAQEELNCGVWSFKTLGEDLRNVFYLPNPESKDKTYDITKEIISQFEEVLADLLLQLFDRDDDFVQTANVDNCENCIYANFCV